MRILLMGAFLCYNTNIRSIVVGNLYNVIKRVVVQELIKVCRK